MLEDDARETANRYPSASKRYAVGEARSVARRFREGGAFGMAA
jgi:hypothetical protein